MGNKFCGEGFCNTDASKKSNKNQRKTTAEPKSSYINPSFLEATPEAKNGNEPVPSDFALEKMVGKCETGSVYVVNHIPSKTRYLMKVLDKKALNKSPYASRLMKDRRVLSENTCPFLIRRVFRFDIPDKICEIVEHIEGTDLRQRLISGRLDEDVVRVYAAEVLLALNWLHTQGLAYKELMPSNVIISSEGHAKLNDFGVSRTTGDVTISWALPRLEYIAPEVVEFERVGVAMDYWSLGVLIYEMLAGSSPIQADADDKRTYLNTVKNSKIPMKYWFSTDSSSLLSRLLITDPENRLKSFNEVKNHPFFININWDNLHLKETPITARSIAEDSEDQNETSFMFEPEFEQMLAYGFTFKIDRASLKSVLGGT